MIVQYNFANRTMSCIENLVEKSRLNPVYLLIGLSFLDLRFRSGSCFSAGMFIHGTYRMGQ